MKAKIHPKYYPDAKVNCACGNSFTTGATLPEIQVEICHACHPFYNNQLSQIFTRGRVEAFRKKQARAAKKVISKAEKRKAKRQKRIREELEKPEQIDASRTKQ